MKHLQSQQAWAYIEGELDWHQKVKMDSHLEECKECQALVDETRRLQQTMTYVMSSEVPPATSDFHSTLLEALRADAESHVPLRKSRSKRVRQRRIQYSLGSAAAVILAVGIGWFALNGKIAFPASNPAGNRVAVGMTSDSVGHHPRTGQTGGPVSNRHTTGVIENLTSPAPSADNLANPGQASLATTTVPDSLTGLALFQVQTPSGQPVSSAHVAVMAGGHLLATGLTDANGAVRPLRVSVPVDPVLLPLFSATAMPEQGVMTVVVWKQGYQPVVSYDVRVFAGGSSQFAQSLTLNPGSENPTPALVGYGYAQNRQGYQTPTLSAFVDWAKQALAAQPSRTSTGQTPQPASTAENNNASLAPGHIQVKVVDQNGHAIKGAKVVVVAGSRISGSGSTDTEGQAPVIATEGIADWRFVGPWNISNLSPETTAIVVWKQGYAPAVGMYVPISSASPTSVTVKLDSLAWRKSMGWYNLSAPSTITPERLPTITNAVSYLAWATGQGY